MILARGWVPWPAGVTAPCLVAECGTQAMYAKPGGGYCAAHTRDLGGLLLTGEETAPTVLDNRVDRLVRLEILAKVAAAVLAAVEAAPSVEVQAAITSLGIRVQNAVLGKERT